MLLMVTQFLLQHLINLLNVKVLNVSFLDLLNHILIIQQLVLQFSDPAPGLGCLHLISSIVGEAGDRGNT